MKAQKARKTLQKAVKNSPSPSTGIKDMPNKDETAGLDFLDFLFTVAISVGLTPELLGADGVKGLLSETWQLQGQWPDAKEGFKVFVFILGFLNLNLSWYGYHASIRTRPLNYNSTCGLLRFILDVSLVILYGVILIKFKSFHVVIWLFVIVWLVFFLWDCLKVLEYLTPPAGNIDDKYFKNKWHNVKNSHPAWSRAQVILQTGRREFVSLFWFIVLFLIAVIPHYFGYDEWLPAVAIGFATLLYRINKIYPLWERILLREL